MEKKNTSGDRILGQMMRRFREELGMSQELLSAVMHIGEHSGKLRRFERGQQMPTPDELQSFCSHLKLPMEKQDRLWERAVAVWRQSGESPRVYPIEMGPGLIAYLRWLYRDAIREAGGTLVERGDLKYPIAFFPANGAPLESVLPQECVDARPDHVISDTDLHRDPVPRRTWNNRLPPEKRKTEGQMTEGWNLCMTKLAVKDRQPILSARLGTYGQVIDSCESMLHEILRVFDEESLTPEDFQKFPYILERLPLRKRLHDREKNPIIQAQYRAAGLGVVAPVCFMTEDGTLATIIQRRSATVASFQQAMHVVPGGMLGWHFGVEAAPNGTPEHQWGSFEAGDIALTMLVEYAEELLSDEPELHRGRDLVRNHPPIHSLLNRYHAEVIYTGVAIDLPILQAHICAIIFVPSVQWRIEYPFKFKLNWEYLDYDSPDRQIAFTSINTDASGFEKMRPEITVPSGAAAFWYGVDAARKRLDSLL